MFAEVHKPWSACRAGEVSPELVLVATRAQAALARLQLPVPESLDDWLFRMHWQDTERGLREFLAEARERQEHVNEARGHAGALVFAAGSIVISLIPIVPFVVGV